MRIQTFLFCATSLLVGTLFADSKEDVTKAAKALSEKENYSWRTSVTVPADAQFRPGPTEGKTEKGGATYVKMSFNDNTTECVIKGKNVAIKSEESGWQSASELENGEGRGRFMAARMRNFSAPAEQALEIAQ